MSGKKPYSERLADGRWQMFRTNLLNAVNWKCQDCGAEGKEGAWMQIHHIFYLVGKDPWDYPESLLRCVCDSCHELRAPVEQTIFIALAELMNRPLEELREWPLWIMHTPGIDLKGPPEQ
jgi:hypothetical protein